MHCYFEALPLWTPVRVPEVACTLTQYGNESKWITSLLLLSFYFWETSFYTEQANGIFQREAIKELGCSWSFSDESTENIELRVFHTIHR